MSELALVLFAALLPGMKELPPGCPQPQAGETRRPASCARLPAPADAAQPAGSAAAPLAAVRPGQSPAPRPRRRTEVAQNEPQR